MPRLPRIFCFLVLMSLSSAAAQALTVGAYWAFQIEQEAGSNYSNFGTFSEAVNVTNWPNGEPSFAYSGSRKTIFDNYGSDYTAYDGSTWGRGKALAWNASAGSSTGNSFQVTLDTTGVEDISVRFGYRLNGVQSSAGLVTALSAFEYSVDGGGFISVPGVSLALNNNGTWGDEWSADLSTATAIENAGLVTLRWTLPDLAQGANQQIRVDDLELIGSYSLGNYTNSSTELLELRTLVGIYTPSTFSANAVSYSLSGVDAADFDISSSGELTLINAPVFANQSSYSVVIEMTDSQDPSNFEQEAVTLSILKSAAITSRERHHPAEQYNVLFIPVDDLRPLLNVYGEDDPLKPITINGESGTPNFDRLAASGVTFLNAHCQQAICTASRVSFLTGLRPDTTRNWNLESKFRDIMPNVVTLPQHFSDNGYKTFGVGKIFHGQSNNHQDDDHITGADSWNEGWQNPSNGRFNFYERGDNPNVWNTWDKAAMSNSSSVSATDVGEYKRDGVTKIEDSDYKDGHAADLAVAKIAEYAISGEPFFLGLGFQKPHLPFNAPKDYWDLYDPSAIDMSYYQEIRDMPVGTNSFTSPYGGEPTSYGDGETYLPTVAEPDLGIFFVDRMPSLDSARHLIHGYMACVSFIDTQLGKVLDALEDPNGDGSNADSIADNTIVILFGDHGFHLGDHGAFWAKHSNYEISTRVPFIIRSPGMSALGTSGTMTNAPVELVDVFPTLLDLCSLPVPDETTSVTNDITRYQILEGTTLLPLLEDSQQPWKSVAFSQYQRYISYKSSYDSDRPLSPAGGGKGMGYSIRTDRYRYTEWWKTRGDYGKFGSNDANNPYDPDASRVVASEASLVELYDYQNDPGETENLAYTQASAYAALISELQALLHDSDNSDYVGDGWKKDLQASPYNVPASYPVTKSQWSTLHQTPGHSTTDFADAADPDQDGIPNLMEYAMGTHPLEQNTAQVSMSHSAGAIAIQYPEVLTRSDVSLIPETSASLETSGWSSVSATTIDTVGSKRMQEASLPTSNTKGFLRLRAVGE
ncbi:MAG: sulfatase [Opitutae bacterium]|nr:sulfatase [Opitutae bacterium]